MTTTSTPTGPNDLEHVDNSIGGLVRAYVTRIRGGDVGALPAILGLVALVVVFSILKPQQFTNAFNFANLINQGAAVIVLAMGLVFVLLLGEIDLSAGYTAGTAASVMGIVMTRHDYNWIVSIVACLATGAVIGTAIGLLVARLQIPSFVVTLAFFLALQGLMLVLIGEGGTIPYRNDKILAIMNSQLPVWLGWVLALAGLAMYAVVTLRNSTARRKKGLQADPFIVWAAKTGALSAILIAATAYLSRERSRNPALSSLKGIPIVVVVVAALLIVLTFLLSRTAWGRHVYAVGGNAEAARRAGINVPHGEAVLLHHVLIAGSHRRHPAGQQDQLRLALDGWAADPAVRGGCSRHRWHEPLRRQGQGRRCVDRRLRRGRHRQRDGPAQPAAWTGVHGDGRCPAACRQRRCDQQATSRGDWETVSGEPGPGRAASW